MTPQSAANMRPPEPVEAETPAVATGATGSASGVVTLLARSGLAFAPQAGAGVGALALLAMVIAASHPKITAR